MCLYLSLTSCVPSLYLHTSVGIDDAHSEASHSWSYARAFDASIHFRALPAVSKVATGFDAYCQSSLVATSHTAS